MDYELENHKSKFNKFVIYDISIIILIITIALILFRGWIGYGMEFDEVYRASNVYSIFNPDAFKWSQEIYSINFLGHSVPIMYKEYLSSAMLLQYIPVLIKGNPIVVIRVTYLVYYVISMVVMYFAFKKCSRGFATSLVLLAMTMPCLFPYIRFQWANLIPAISISLAFILFNKYKSSEKPYFIFLISLILFLNVNMQFYFIWNLVGITVTLILLYPKKALRFISNIRNMLLVFMGMIIGCFNYVIYNINNKFPTFEKLFNFLFEKDTYNLNKIDGRNSPAIMDKINSYLYCFGTADKLYIALTIIMILTFFAISIYLFKNKIFQQEKKYFIGIGLFILSFFAMLISPNSQGAHHLCYMVIPWTLALVSLIFLIRKLFTGKVLILILLLILINLYTCNNKVIAANNNPGTGYFTSSIFNMLEYANQNNYEGEDLLFVDWGFHSQFYFSERGEFDINALVFQLKWKEKDEIYQYLDSVGAIKDNQPYYIPCYVFTENTEDGIDSDKLIMDKGDCEYSFYAETEHFLQYYINKGAEVHIEKVFYEKNRDIGVIAFVEINL